MSALVAAARLGRRSTRSVACERSGVGHPALAHNNAAALPADLRVQHRKDTENKDRVKGGIINGLLRKYGRAPIRYLLLLRDPPAEFGLDERGQRRSLPRESVGLEHRAINSSRFQPRMHEVPQIKDGVMGDKLLL